MALSGKQSRHLRGLAHHIKPVVTVGQAGVTPPLVAKTEEELGYHELIKVKVGQGCLDDTKTVAAEISTATGAELVGTIGHVVILYKARKKEPAIVLPKE